MNNFEVWGLPLLVAQTRDSDRTVALTALEILDEACYERVCVETGYGEVIELIFVVHSPFDRCIWRSWSTVGIDSTTLVTVVHF